MRSFAIVAVSIFVAATFLNLLPQTARAQGSAVQAIVCNADSNQLVVDAPITDTTVNSSPIMLRGSVYRVSQIEIYVDDQYAQSVQISEGETVFTASVALSEGTHTIKVVAIDMCAANSEEKEIVITYQPKIRTESETPPAVIDTGSGGVVVTNENQDIAQVTSGINPFQAVFIDPVKRFATYFDLYVPAPASENAGTKNIFRLILIITGLALLVLPLFGRLYARVKKVLIAQYRMTKQRVEFFHILRAAVGVLLLLVAFVI